MQPTYFINHGGGPCFFIEPPAFFRTAFQQLENYLKGFASELSERPKAILIISSHWEQAAPTVNAGAAPPLLYDYSGFPAYTYQLTYPAPGSPNLAIRVCDLLSQAGIFCAVDVVRVWNHGVFVPLKVMFPDADIPVVQLSMQHGYNPAAHLAIGRALTLLRDEGVLIVGSGQTYHNMGGVQGAVGKRTRPPRLSICGSASGFSTVRRATRRWSRGRRLRALGNRSRRRIISCR